MIQVSSDCDPTTVGSGTDPVPQVSPSCSIPSSRRSSSGRTTWTRQTRCRSGIASSCPRHRHGRLRLTKRKRGCLLVTHPGVAVLHSKHRSCVITAAFCLPIPLCAYLSPVSLSHCTPPHFSHFAFLELAPNPYTQTESCCPPSCLFSYPLCHDVPALCSLMITFYPRSACILLYLSLFLARVSFQTPYRSLASPPSTFPFPFPPPSTPSPPSV